MANVIITTMGSGGDVFPFISIGSALAARGHEVTLLTHAYFENAARRAQLNFVPLDTLPESEQMLRDGPELNSPAGLSRFLDKHVLPRIPAEVNLIRQCFIPGRTVLMTRSGPGFGARIAAEQMGIPLVAVLMAPAHVLGLPMYEQLVQSKIGAVVNHWRSTLGLDAIEEWKPWLRYHRSVGLWPEWFCAADSSWPPGIQLVGFVLSEDPAAGDVEEPLRQALATGPPTVLISAGTGFFGGPEFFEIAINGCRIAGCRPLVVCRHDNLIPRELRSGAIVLSEVPSLGALMPLVAVVCHHGGMGTLGQAIAAGAPQLVIAQGGDRPDNAARLQRLGIAEFIRLRERTAERVAAALTRLMHSPAVRERCQALTASLCDRGTMDLIAESVDAALLKTEANAVR